MQIDLLKEKHVEFLQNRFGISRDVFISICEDDDEERFDKLLDDLTWLECDASEEKGDYDNYTEEDYLVSELIDIMCGPYDDIEQSDETE